MKKQAALETIARQVYDRVFRIKLASHGFPVNDPASLHQLVFLAKDLRESLQFRSKVTPVARKAAALILRSDPQVKKACKALFKK